MLFAAAVHCQPLHDLFGTGQFHRAYFDAGRKELTFDPFERLDWEGKARAALPWLNLDRPAPPQIARLSTFESAGPLFRSVEFHAPLDPAVNRSAYLLIYADGVAVMRGVGLKGAVNLNFDSAMTSVVDRTVSGTVVGQISRSPTSAAFAVVGRLADVQDVRKGVKFEWAAPPNERADPASALSFRLAGRRLMLVKWKRGLCSSSYTLFAIEPALKPIASNDYDCDP